MIHHWLLPAFHAKLIRSRETKVPHKAQSNGLRTLPTEIIILILHQLDDTELYSLALLSKTLHHLALLQLFSRSSHQIEPAEIKLRTPEKTYIRALRICLFMPSIHSFHYTFALPDVITDLLEEINGVTRLMSKFARVDIVTLNFMEADICQDFGLAAGAILNLLKTVARKGCTSLGVDGIGTSSTSNQVHPPAYRVLHNLQGSIDAVSGMWRLSMRGTGKKHACDTKHHLFTGGRHRTLAITIFSISARMMMKPPLCCWTISTLNRSPIERLSFPWESTPLICWENFLPYVTIPSLSSLNIPGGKIPWRDLRRFLNRHKNLHSLTLSMSSQESDPYLLTGAKLSLPNLTKLTALPSCAIPFLHSLDTLPKLKELVILFYVHHTEGYWVNRCLAPFINRFTDVEVTVELVAGSMPVDWMTRVADEQTASAKPTALKLATHLLFNMNIDHNLLSSHDERNVFSAWLCLNFPSLKTICFRLGLSCMTHVVKFSFMRQLSVLCPGLEKITIGYGKEYSTAELLEESFKLL